MQSDLELSLPCNTLSFSASPHNTALILVVHHYPQAHGTLLGWLNAKNQLEMLHLQTEYYPMHAHSSLIYQQPVYSAQSLLFSICSQEDLAAVSFKATLKFGVSIFTGASQQKCKTSRFTLNQCAVTKLSAAVDSPFQTQRFQPAVTQDAANQLSCSR